MGNFIEQILIFVLIFLFNQSKSDHGMTQLKENKIIPLDRYLDLSKINREKTVYGIVANIHPTSPDQVKAFIFKIRRQSFCVFF